MSLHQQVIKQAAMSAYRHSHGLAHDEHLPAISKKLRRPAQLAAAKLQPGLQSDHFSKTLDRAVNKQLVIQTCNHDYTVCEAKTGVYRLIIDMKLTNQIIQEQYGIAERTETTRIREIRALHQYQMIFGDTNSFRRHLIDRPDMHDDLFKAICHLHKVVPAKCRK